MNDPPFFSQKKISRVGILLWEMHRDFGTDNMRQKKKIFQQNHEMTAVFVSRFVIVPRQVSKNPKLEFRRKKKSLGNMGTLRA